MRLTLIIPSLAPGGAERVMGIMANHWAARGVAVTLLTYDDGGNRPFYVLDPRVVHRSWGLERKPKHIFRAVSNFLKNVGGIRRALIESRPDAVISFMEVTNVLTLTALLGTGIPVVISERTNPEVYEVKRFWKALRRLTYGLAGRLVVQTERTAQCFLPRLEGKVTVIPNPVLPPRTDGGPEEFSLEGLDVVSVGRLVPEKGFDLLIDAFAEIAPRHPARTLSIFGSGPARSSLEAQVKKRGMEGRIRLPGTIKNPYSALAKARIYVSSSRFEGFPNALCEAMASGLPVISTDCPNGPREIIRDGVDGLLVPNQEAPALARALERLMSDENLQRELGSKATEITARFGLEKVMGLWEEVLRAIGAWKTDAF